MRVQLVDPPGDTPPYDHRWRSARAGTDVELSTSRYLYGPAPQPCGFRVREDFYRARQAGGGRHRPPRLRAALEHVPDMIRHRRARGGRRRPLPVAHARELDAWLLARARARFTSHNVLRRRAAPRAGARAWWRTLGRGGRAHPWRARELLGRFGADRRACESSPGAFDYLTSQDDEQPLPDDLAAVERPVILWFGVLRPYKGVDVLIEAFREVEGAELWVVGRPWMAVERLKEAASRAGGPCASSIAS